MTKGRADSTTPGRSLMAGCLELPCQGRRRRLLCLIVPRPSLRRCPSSRPPGAIPAGTTMRSVGTETSPGGAHRQALLCTEGGETMKLTVSPNGRHLVRQDGAPFFYLGDTAWLIFQRLNHEEVEEYLKD